MKLYYVYVIESKEGFKYTGMTEDLQERLEQHNDRTLSFWTKRGTNWKLIYKEEFDNKTEALKREKWLKTGVGRDYLKKILEKQSCRFNPPRRTVPATKQKNPSLLWGFFVLNSNRRGFTVLPARRNDLSSGAKARMEV